ncbi:MAG: hypothetical protein LBF87_04065 [Treponema sp.]|jgi:hypothetical protein|nr:hypothetical protein [Treponema sp.]
MNYGERLLEAQVINVLLFLSFADFQAVGLKTAYSLTVLGNKRGVAENRRDALWCNKPLPCYGVCPPPPPLLLLFICIVYELYRISQRGQGDAHEQQTIGGDHCFVFISAAPNDLVSDSALIENRKGGLL